MNDHSLGFWILWIAGVVLPVIFFYVFLTTMSQFVRTVRAGVPIAPPVFWLMRLRRRPVRMLVDAYVLLRHKDVAITLAEVEHFHVQNGNRLTTAEELAELIAAERAQGDS